MSGVKHNVSNAPTGNPLVDGVIAGGTIWDPAQGPVKVASYNKTTVSADWDSLMQSRNGVPSEVITDRSLTRYWTGSQGESMYNAAAAFEAVSGIKFERVATHTDADILWFAAGFLGVHAKSGGLPFLGEGPSDVHQTWGYLADNSPYNPSGPTDGSWDFWGSYDPKGGIGFQNQLAVVAQTIGLKVSASNPYGSPYSLMSPNFIPADSNRSSGYGFMKTPGAIDIAAVQALYGANMQTATGDNTYELPTANVAGVGWTTIWDAGGIDTISAANSTKPVSINLKAASLDASDPNGGGYFSRQINVYGGFSIAKGVVIENATGGSSNDLLVGNEAANRLSGGAGDDTYYIGRGDTVVDSSGRDTVYASFAFSDSAIENVFVNHVAVKGGGQLIRGTSGRNTLNGTAGNDILSGGQGNDRLKGFDGHDVFLFNTKPSASNIDKIMDFSVAEDTIQLSKSIFNHVQSSKGILKKSAFWKGSAAHDSNDHIIYDSARGALYYDPDGKGGEAAIKFATITPRLNMTADDFVLI